ncbi:MAG: hypothetical protein AAF297_00335 [Planctomycetota bacterium]
MTALAAMEQDYIMLMVFGGIGGVIALTAIVFGTFRRVAESKHRERARSEIAAYVAEGSMTADEGERLLEAGKKAAS